LPVKAHCILRHIWKQNIQVICRGDSIASDVTNLLHPGSGGDEIRVAEGTIAFHCAKHHSSYRSTDFTSNLMKKIFTDLEMALKLTSTERKQKHL
jgi:hypothetical protein